jgi:hypothetical protein
VVRSLQPVHQRREVPVDRARQDGGEGQRQQKLRRAHLDLSGVADDQRQKECGGSGVAHEGRQDAGRQHEDGKEDRWILSRQIEHAAAEDFHDTGLKQTGRHHQEAQNHHHRVAAEARKRLLGRKQSRGDNGQHHTQGNDIGRDASPSEEQDCGGEDYQANRNVGRHAPLVL